MGIIEYLKMVRATPVWDRVPAISDTELDAMIDILQKNKSINGVSILKCDECNGTGYVAIAPGVRGIRKCSMCNGTGEITTIPPSQTKGEHRAAKISEIIRDLQEIQEKYGDVRVKQSEGYGVKRVKAEYDNVARIADELGISINETRRLIGEELEKNEQQV